MSPINELVIDPDLDLVFERVVDVPVEPEGGGTRYRAIARHGNVETRDKHEEMGFFDGWSAALDQLVEHAATM